MNNSPTFQVLHRPEGSVEQDRDLWERETVNAETAEGAIRKVLTDHQILHYQYLVNKIGDGYTSDEFHHDGVFDDVQEKAERIKREHR